MSKIRFASEEYVDSKLAGAATVQPDWAQNDPNAPGYIKNRPFYSEIQTLMETQTIEGFTLEENSGGIYAAPIIPCEFDVEIGEITVFYDGVEYKTEAEDFDGFIAFGNLMIVGGGEDNGVPFCIVVGNMDNNRIMQIIICDGSTATSHTIGICKEIPKKIDPKYIKDMYYEIPKVGYTFEFTDPIITSISTTMLVPKPNFWAADKTYRIWVDGEEYVFEGMESKSGGNPFAMETVYYIGAEWWAFNANMDFSEYPFSFVTADFENVYAVFEDGTTNHTVEVIEKEGEIKKIDPKYLPEKPKIIFEVDEEVLEYGNARVATNVEDLFTHLMDCIQNNEIPNCICRCSYEKSNEIIPVTGIMYDTNDSVIWCTFAHYTSLIDFSLTYIAYQFKVTSDNELGFAVIS